MRIINLSEGKFKSIINKGMSLDILFLLELVKEGVDVKQSFKEGKVNSLISTLERRGYVKEGVITKTGDELYNSLTSEEEGVVVKKMENKDKEWEEFLSYYPPNNRFIWRGRAFSGDRGIKNNTKDGKEIFTNILNNTTISCEELWRAVIAEAVAKMDESYKKGENKMQYFINTTSWLRQQRYLNFLEEGKVLKAEEISAYKQAYNRNKSSRSSSSKTVDI
jgi:hypothetical protein